ncbi:TPA: hypothetical protein VCK39_001444 [Streptococcus pyogenes]|nr:hypothetical protein [Streptococcus pyogenes]HEP1515034.1 hypothetical protein [Streptococcus pyogenes]HEP2625974.1 hypothetical protein [Streptococcus pyogenes]HEP2628605.1 hypothetical protein [Streptococcus pyogenes]HEP2695368.1 hypothetical protein [Streptococcus pyogenes]
MGRKEVNVMDLNQVRLLEACFVYLKTRLDSSMQTELDDSKLFFEVNGNMFTFDTYETKYDRYDFIENNLGNIEVSVDYKSLREVSDLFEATKINEHQSVTLRNIDNTDMAKKLIFKTLTQVDLKNLKGKYPDFKTNNFAYNVHDLTLNKHFSCYQFLENDSFKLIAID